MIKSNDISGPVGSVGLPGPVGSPGISMLTICDNCLEKIDMWHATPYKCKNCKHSNTIEVTQLQLKKLIREKMIESILFQEDKHTSHGID